MLLLSMIGGGASYSMGYTSTTQAYQVAIQRARERGVVWGSVRDTVKVWDMHEMLNTGLEHQSGILSM